MVGTGVPDGPSNPDVVLCRDRRPRRSFYVEATAEPPEISNFIVGQGLMTEGNPFSGSRRSLPKTQPQRRFIDAAVNC